MLPFPRPQPWALQWAVGSFQPTWLLHDQWSLLLPALFLPTPLPLCWFLVLSSLFTVLPSLLCQRETWGTLPTQENDLGLLALSLISLFHANTGFWVFYLPGSEEGVANSFYLFCPQRDVMPSSQSHEATLVAGPGGPYSFLWPGTELHGWDGLTPSLAFWAVDMCVFA